MNYDIFHAGLPSPPGRKCRNSRPDPPSRSDALRRALPRVQARVAGIWGDRDAFTGRRLDEVRHALASSRPPVDLRVIEGAGRWAPYEAPERVNAALVDLLAGV